MKKLFTLIIVALLTLLTACSSGQGEDKKPTIKLADGTWDSVKFHTAVAQFIIENGYGYETQLIPGSTPAILTGLTNGDIDIYMENWTDNIIDQYTEMIESGDVLELSVNFEDNAQGWYVPTYMIEGDSARNIEPMAPDLRSVDDLAKYWELFKDPEDPSKGRIYGGIAGWEVDQTLTVKMETFNLNEHFNYFRPGSEAALNTSLVRAYERGEAWVGYNWEPTWVTGKYDLTLLEEPEYTKEGWENGFATAFPSNRCTVNSHKSLPEKAPDITEFLKNYSTNSALISEALAQMEEQGFTIDEVAKWFLEEHEEVWTEWVPEDVVNKVKSSL
jgi:glycine betaine/proline transport system substrate-binding protein